MTAADVAAGHSDKPVATAIAAARFALGPDDFESRGPGVRAVPRSPRLVPSMADDLFISQSAGDLQPVASFKRFPRQLRLGNTQQPRRSVRDGGSGVW